MRPTISLALLGAFALAAPAATPESGFHDPEPVIAGGDPVRMESPGFAAPCLADIDGDGLRDLLVGQFADGKIGVYKGIEAITPGGLAFAAREWLQAGGADAVVPGVW